MPRRQSVPALAIGLTGTCSAAVDAEDTCRSQGSGDLEMLATPRVLALVERAAGNAVGDALPPDLTMVGVRVELEHVLPVAVGRTVNASASLIAVRGRRLTFAVKVLDQGERVIAVGRLTRAVVERATFGVDA